MVRGGAVLSANSILLQQTIAPGDDQSHLNMVYCMSTGEPSKS